MHKYRHRARHLAWYDDDDGVTSRNPFRKFRTFPRRTDSIQLESNLSHPRTVADAPPRQDERRRKSDPGANLVVGSGMVASASDLAAAPESNERIGLAAPSTHSEDLLSDERIEAGTPRRRKNPFAKSDQYSQDTDSLPSNEPRRPGTDQQRFTLVGQLKATIFNSWINVLLICAPVGIALNYIHVNPVAVFVVNFIAIIPLAAMLSYATEEIAMRTGETIGGLLNATFGNAVELIVAILALVADEVLIVQTSLIGSMLSNLLLVMGMCFFFGGVNRLEQHFNPVVAQTAASLLALSVSSLIIPTAFHAWSGAGERGIAPLSRATAVILLAVYGCYLFFQLKSHADLYNAPSPKVEKRWVRITEGDAHRGMANIGRHLAAYGGGQAQQMPFNASGDEHEEPQLSVFVAILTLVISTAFVAVCAEYMVNSINALVSTGGISKTFVGLILLPIVGNAAEHATAVTVACKDKMDLAIGVAVGSSMQIALLVLPLVVVVGWIIGNSQMTLYFDPFQVILLFVAVLLVNYLISDGKSHWLEGVLLQMMYLIIAVAAWFYPI